MEIVGGGAISTTGFTVRRDSDGRMGVTAAGHAPNSGPVGPVRHPVAQLDDRGGSIRIERI